MSATAHSLNPEPPPKALDAALEVLKRLNVAAGLRAARNDLDISQSEAAMRLGVNLRTYQGWESGRSGTLPPALRALIDLSQTSADG